MYDDIDHYLIKDECESSHLFFTRWFFKARQSIKFKVNWHHQLIADIIDDIIQGKKKNVVITVSPGSSKTELVVINFIARGLALNPWARFLHLSGSDSLASLNSATARDIVTSDEYQKLWPMQIAEDAKAKKRWNVLVGGKIAGGVYATSIGGQVTGFRAGHMAEGFTGALIIDDPQKPEDAFSKTKMDAANRKLLTTIKSRRANPDVPMILIMQRISENDAAGFVLNGGVEGHWDHIKIPAVIDENYVAALDSKYQSFVSRDEVSDGRFSYWPYKEPLEQLLAMERGDGADQGGARISRHVFSSQYQQAPIALGGNIIRGEWFKRYTVLPRIKWRKIYADTAMKTGQHNDNSVMQEWGVGVDGLIYLLDTVVGRFDSPELQRRAVAFWAKGRARDAEHFGQLRKLVIEDKASGTGLLQSLRYPPYNIPVEPIEPQKDKLTRCMDALPYIECGQVCLPEGAPFTQDLIAECESFTADDSHNLDDRCDCLFYATQDMLQSGNKLRQWESLAKGM
jgi:predicted phage terminase large subunit-like protein